MSTYRLSWEIVHPHDLHLFSDADPAYYSNTTQTVPNSQIPDEYWYKIVKESGDPWSQYNQLKEWSDNDEQFVRNVKLEKQVATPTWEEV